MTRDKEELVNIVEEKEFFKVGKHLPNPTVFGYWHKQCHIDFEKTKLNFAGLVTGCGLGQIYGISHLAQLIKKNKLTLTSSEFKEKFKHQIKDGVGAVICTLGQNFYEYENIIFELGFELLSEYNNYRHGNCYTQRLYIIKL